MLGRWETAIDDLVATLARPASGPPVATLAAYAGDDPVGRVALRPFAPGEPLEALVEVLALLLPLGADRLVLAAPAHGRRLPTEATDGTNDGANDGAGRGGSSLAVMVVDAAGSAERSRIRARVSLWWATDDPNATSGGGTATGRWVPATEAGGPVVDALMTLLAGRDQLCVGDDARHTATQLARCLARGHQVLLAPAHAARVAAVTVDGVGSAHATHPAGGSPANIGRPHPERCP